MRIPFLLITGLLLLFPANPGECAEGATSEAVATATPEAIDPPESQIDQIIFRSGTVFSGQIVEGTKSLINDPNRYEILLANGQILSILDQGQIERVVMDGQALDDPQKHGGRQRLHQMLTELQNRKDREAAMEGQRKTGLKVEWSLGDVRKQTVGSEERVGLGVGKNLLPGEEIRMSPGSRVLLGLGARLRLGLEQGAHLTLDRVEKDGSDSLGETFEVGLTLHRGTVWVDILGALGGDKPVYLTVSGLTFSPLEGLYELTAGDNEELEFLHYTGSEVRVVRKSDDEAVAVAPESGVSFTSNMLQGTAPLRPRRAALGDFNEWLEFTEWKPVQIDIPVSFSLVGKPKMEPRPIHPLLGLPSQKFVFQDLQSIRLTGMVPLIETYREALRRFLADVGRPPTEEEGLEALRTAPEGVEGWQGPYLPEGEILMDPWNRAFQYSLIQTPEATLINLYSIGENGIDEQGLGDDLR
jgi:hypothetical protein